MSQDGVQSKALMIQSTGLIGIGIKTRLEEEFLRGELGAACDDYASRVPMLVPFAPNSYSIRNKAPPIE
ncbi:hypothetical protein MESS2_650050 [Mesorhizobium metallidurans STM 2683]|uniref:Uncharacterized protein n=1 Tax=Mesorhizobium metallidurans STM 2683 TaxID=1297569 RepID=M5EV14_9HYPH|nr:hypothetical protein [Mesorhizobium metallidurans]CCV07825.1 hypothetical protein MESS2_650050 [Mesorhizobium metallidurans STM 2683]